LGSLCRDSRRRDQAWPTPPFASGQSAQSAPDRKRVHCGWLHRTRRLWPDPNAGVSQPSTGCGSWRKCAAILLRAIGRKPPPRPALGARNGSNRPAGTLIPERGAIASQRTARASWVPLPHDPLTLPAGSEFLPRWRRRPMRRTLRECVPFPRVRDHWQRAQTPRRVDRTRWSVSC